MNSFKVIYQDPDVLVIEKPAGLLVHEAVGKDEITLADLLLKDFPELKGVGEKPERPGIIHRLDRDVSGLMVVARNQAAYDFLKKQFQERTMKKEYIALVHGHMPRPYDTIKLKIAVILMLLAILGSLASALVFLLRGGERHDARGMARALTWRIGLSMTLFLLLMAGFYFGIISPTGLSPR